jgi:adenylate cyclase
MVQVSLHRTPSTSDGPTDDRAEIFISYARSTEPAALAVQTALAAEGWRVWRDDQLPAHRAYSDVIDERLRAAVAVVVIWSSEAVRSDWVRAEADVARIAGRLVQLSMDGAVPPLPFNQIHCVDLTGWEGDCQAPAWRKVVDSVRALAGEHSVAPADASRAPPIAAKPSLAVLPFANLSPAPDQDYFVDGMMDEIVTALTRIRSLFVIAGRATHALRGDELRPGAAAKRLGVRYILEGSVRRAGDKVRISVRLTDSDAGTQIWAERFEGTLEDVFALQDQVALSVAGVIEPAVLNAEANRAARRPLESLGAYDLYLRAAALRATLHRAEVHEALALLERALALEPDFAPALAHAAGCHSQILVNGWDRDFKTHRSETRRLAERAAQCGADDPSALAQAANALVDLGGDMEMATALIERAVTLNPGSAFACLVCGIVRIIRGDADEAIEPLEQAARLDPVSRFHDVAIAHIGVSLAMRGEHAEAARIMARSTHRPPRLRLALAAVYGHLGRLEEAKRELDLYREEADVPVEVMSRQMARGSIHAKLMDGLAHVGVGQPTESKKS